MEHTTNFQLSQWAAEDRILREDFNSDNAKIEAALADMASTVSAAVEAAGNCEIAVLSYTGTGTNGLGFPSLAFPWTPALVVVTGDNGLLVLHKGPANIVLSSSGGNGLCYAQWSGNTLQLYSRENDAGWSQMNRKGISYQAVGLRAK